MSGERQPGGAVVTPGGRPPRRIDRYVLEDLVADSGGIQLWRATDATLGRPVSLRLLPLDHPRVPAVRAAARSAAMVDDRRLVRVLDVLEVAGRLVVAAEWVPGRTLADLLDEREGEPLPARNALAIAREVTRGVAAGHELGVGHGRLRPGAVLITDVGEVRVRGLGVDAALYGVVPAQLEHDVERADVHGVGSLLYCAATGRWPDGLADGLPPAPRAGERVLQPSRVVADVPGSVDEVTARSVLDMAPPRGKAPYDTLAELAAGLTLAVDTLPAAARAAGAEPPPRRPHPAWRRWLVRLVAALAILTVAGALAVLGVNLVTGAGSPWGVNPTPVSSAFLTKTAAPSVPLVPGQASSLPIVAAKDFDPFGSDRVENPDQVPQAIDDDPISAWTTRRYRTPTMDKPGVGLLLDLGTPRPVTTVDLQLVGNGSDVTVFVGDDPEADPTATGTAWKTLASVQGAGTQITLRSPRQLVGRYVLVWFTKAPPVDNRYQAGIRAVGVR